MSSDSLSVPAMIAAVGVKTQLMTLRKPSFSIARQTWSFKISRLTLYIVGLPHAGMTSGLSTKRFGSTSRTGSAKALSLSMMRRKSRPDALGAR
ncbi:MAG: hypothetical protein QM820_55140 [Minicystis sp.]